MGALPRGAQPVEGDIEVKHVHSLLSEEAELTTFEVLLPMALTEVSNPEIADRTRLFHHFASGAQITRLSVDPDRGMAGRTAQAVIDVLEGNYEGDPTKMPYVVNKEAFLKS